MQSVIGYDYSESDEDDTEERNGSEPPEEEGIPHRWRVVAMMAAGFVLCNMDKVWLWPSYLPGAGHS